MSGRSSADELPDARDPSSAPAPGALPVIHCLADAGALADAAAAWIAGALARAIAERGRASIALAGGSTPRALHARLAGAPVPAIDWAVVSIYFGDERCVAPDDPASNHRMARESLLDLVPVPAAQVFRIEGELAPDDAAARYHALLAAAPPLDVVVLGMGDDGHVASWFADTPPFPDGALAVASTSPRPPHARVTLTDRAIGQARDVVLVVSGAAKAARLAEVHAELCAGEPVLPAARVTAAGGVPRWFIDEAAASALPRSNKETT